MFFIDGPDGAGKTTLIERLREFFPLPFFHSGGPWESLSDGRGRLLKICEKKYFFCDRFPYLSEYIYGPILRSAHFFPFEDLANVCSDFLQETYLIYVRPSTTTLYKNIVKQAIKDHKPQAHINAVTEKYKQIIKKYDSTILKLSFYPGMRTIHFNWEETQTEELIQCVGSLLPSGSIKGKLPGPCAQKWDTED